MVVSFAICCWLVAAAQVRRQVEDTDVDVKGQIEAVQAIQELEKRAAKLTAETFSRLTPEQRRMVACHPARYISSSVCFPTLIVLIILHSCTEVRPVFDRSSRPVRKLLREP
jgi:hypothetical protein